MKKKYISFDKIKFPSKPDVKHRRERLESGYARLRSQIRWLRKHGAFWGCARQVSRSVRSSKPTMS
jgi:hypothetical protein